jgi:hypothetical protein
MIKRPTIWMVALVIPSLVILTAPKDAPLLIASAAAQTAPAALSEAQDVNGATGVVAEIVQCKRDSGVLSIRMRLRNTGDAAAEVKVLASGDWYDRYYVTAGSKKYFVLRDSEKTPLANPPTSYGALSVEIPKGGTYVWYAKYQAPPAEIKKVNYYTPISAPFEDVPISD